MRLVPPSSTPRFVSLVAAIGLVAVAAAAAPAAAQGAYAGATARSERQMGIAQKVGAALGQALTTHGVDDVTIRVKSEDPQGKIEDLGRILKDARGRFFDTEFEEASKAAFNGMKRFEDGFAFTNNRDAWALYGELAFVRTMALQRLGQNAKADRTLALLAAVYPSYVPDPSLVPPKVASRFQQVVGRLNKMGTVSLNIASRPAGAEAIVDGKVVGITPLDVTDLLPGPHFVSVSLGPDRAKEKVVLRKGAGTARFDIGDPRAGNARALVSALQRAQSPEAILDAAKEVDTRTFAAVVLPAGGDIEVLLGRFDGERLAAVSGTPIKDDLSDLAPAVERLAEASLDGVGEVWLARPGETSPQPEDLRGRFLGTNQVGNSGGEVEPIPEADFPVAAVAIGGGIVAAVLVAAAVGTGIVYVVTLPSNPGGTDLLIDSSRLAVQP